MRRVDAKNNMITIHYRQSDVRILNKITISTDGTAAGQNGDDLRDFEHGKSEPNNMFYRELQSGHKCVFRGQAPIYQKYQAAPPFAASG